MSVLGIPRGGGDDASEPASPAPSVAPSGRGGRELKKVESCASVASGVSVSQDQQVISPELPIVKAGGNEKRGNPREEDREEETLEGLLAMLAASTANLKRDKDKAESKRAAAARRAASARAGRFTGGGPWRRPRSVPDQFELAKRLPPGDFFSPFQAATVDRPLKAFEKIEGPPFIAYDSNLRMFGEPPPLVLNLSKLDDPAKPRRKSVKRSGTSQCLGDTMGAATGRAGSKEFFNCKPQKTPRAAKLAGMVTSGEPPQWSKTRALPGELSLHEFLDTRRSIVPGEALNSKPKFKNLGSLSAR